RLHQPVDRVSVASDVCLRYSGPEVPWAENRVSRAEADRFLDMRQRLAGTTHVDLSAPQLPMRQRIVGVEMDGVLEPCDRLGVLATRAQIGAAQHVESGILWVERHGPVRSDLSLPEEHLQLLLWHPPVANMVDPGPGRALQSRNRVRVKGARLVEVGD